MHFPHNCGVWPLSKAYHAFLHLWIYFSHFSRQLLASVYENWDCFKNTFLLVHLCSSFFKPQHPRFKCYLLDIISVTSYVVRITKHGQCEEDNVERLLSSLSSLWACHKYTGSQCFSCIAFILVTSPKNKPFVALFVFLISHRQISAWTCSWQISLPECYIHLWNILWIQGSSCSWLSMLNAVFSSPPTLHSQPPPSVPTPKINVWPVGNSEGTVITAQQLCMFPK